MESPNVRPHVPTLGVSVEAVKEQLLLLGHTIPDDVIKAFLDDGLSGFQGVGPFHTPIHKRPEAHAACTALTASHVGSNTASAALQGQSRALEEPRASALKEAEPAHCMQTFLAGSVPSVGAATAMTAPALTAAPPRIRNEQVPASPHTGLAEDKTIESCCMPASAMLGYGEPQSCLALSVPIPSESPVPATSHQLSPCFAGLEIKAAPAAEGCNAVHPSLTSFRSVRAHASASLAPAAGAWTADSAHARAASAQPVGRSSDVLDHAARTCLPPGQVPSWRQLISQPLYPEKLPAVGESQGAASSAPDLAPFAAHRQEGTPRVSGPSCPHCRARFGEVPSSSSGRAVVKGRAWSAELYQGLSGIRCSDAGTSKVVAPGAASEAPRASAAHSGNAPRPAQHADRAKSASIRGRHSYRRAPVEHLDQPALGKENVKQRSVEPTPPKQAPDALQSRASQPRSAPLGSAVKDDSHPHGPACCAHAPTPSMPRLAIRGPKRLDRVARFRQMQAIWAGDAFLQNGAAGANGAGKRERLGFCKAFADVHAANERMHNLFVDWSAATC